MNDVNFNSVNRLIEFGLGISAAQQMIQMMNATVQNTNMPGQSIPQPSNKEWYIVKEGKPTGPILEKEIKQLLLSHMLTKDDLVWSLGMNEWKQVKDVPDILRMIFQLPPKI